MMRSRKMIVCIGIIVLNLIVNNLIAQETHIVKMKETLSGIAHQYHISVGNLMRYNGLNSKSKLQIGERIKIPSKNQANEPTTVESKSTAKLIKTAKIKEEVLLAPAQTHIVEQGESLFRISQKFKVPVAKLREWNNIPDYTIKIGQELFITKPTEEEIKALQPAKPSTETAEIKTVTEKKVDNKIAETTKIMENKEAQVPVINHTVETAKIVNEADNKEQLESVQSNTTITNSIDTVKKTIKSNVPVTVSEHGFFAKQFVSTQQEITGTASILKTSSGWLDKKYYVLMNNINPGTIVKITYNNNYVYAKVLEALPDIKEDQGLLLRLSNAAVSLLNITDNKFLITVNY